MLFCNSKFRSYDTSTINWCYDKKQFIYSDYGSIIFGVG